MKKLLLVLGTTLLSLNIALAADSVKVAVGTQTYQCTINGNLTCNPVNEVQQQTMTIKKNGGHFQIADAPRNLSADIDTTVENGQVSYAVTFCSHTVCTLSTNNGGVNAYINQTMFGQYNVTEKSFYVLGFFINSQNTSVNLKEKILAQFSKGK